MTLPPVVSLRIADTHRLIPSAYRPEGDSVLTGLADDEAHLADLFALDHATNGRLLAENDQALDIRATDLVFDVPHYRVINASFCHPHPAGGRFNAPDRGAWYCALARRTAQAEVIFHKTVHLAEIGRFVDSVTFDDYLADFAAPLHDLRDAAPFDACLRPDSYQASQALAHAMLGGGSLGVVYPSVRQPSGTCIACFRPSVVVNVRRAATYRMTWHGSPAPEVRREDPEAAAGGHLTRRGRNEE